MRKLTIDVHAGLFLSCLLLIGSFVVGIFLHFPLWEPLTWPEKVLRSSLNYAEYYRFGEAMLARVPPSSTMLGVLLAVLFWWVVAALLVRILPVDLAKVAESISANSVRAWIMVFAAVMLLLIYVLPFRGIAWILFVDVVLHGMFFAVEKLFDALNRGVRQSL